MKQHTRIWELDFLRGVSVFGMILVHFMFDLNYFGGYMIPLPQWFQRMGQYGHILFLLLSGICVTLGEHSVKRGIIVFSSGLLVSYVTLYSDFILGTIDLRIWFGILHLLGVSMMLYPVFRNLSSWLRCFYAIVMISIGFVFSKIYIPYDFLFPFGLCSKDIYTGSDYFPLFPGFGWFLLGSSAGSNFYREKRSLFPKIYDRFPILRFVNFFGKHSLIIYLFHQPVLIFIVYLLSQIK